RPCPMTIELPGSTECVLARSRPRTRSRWLGLTACGPPVLRRVTNCEQSSFDGRLPFRERKRSRGPIRRLFGGAALSPRGWALVGGGYFDWHLPQADESLVVEGDGPQVPGGLDGLRRLHVN